MEGSTGAAGEERVLILGAAGRVSTCGTNCVDVPDEQASLPLPGPSCRPGPQPQQLHPCLRCRPPPPPQDYHTFNTMFRDGPRGRVCRVVGFTHAQIPHIESAAYPGCLAGPKYPGQQSGAARDLKQQAADACVLLAASQGKASCVSP
jgi:hypothetical protein